MRRWTRPVSLAGSAEIKAASCERSDGESGVDNSNRASASEGESRSLSVRRRRTTGKESDLERREERKEGDEGVRPDFKDGLRRRSREEDRVARPIT